LPPLLEAPEPALDVHHVPAIVTRACADDGPLDLLDDVLGDARRADGREHPRPNVRPNQSEVKGAHRAIDGETLGAGPGRRHDPGGFRLTAGYAREARDGDQKLGRPRAICGRDMVGGHPGTVAEKSMVLKVRPFDSMVHGMPAATIVVTRATRDPV
jgi:hypothetical protein